MKAKYLLLVMFWLCFPGPHSVDAADEEIINGQVDKNSIKMVQGQLSNTQSIDIEGSTGINLVNNADNLSPANSSTANTDNVNPAVQAAKPATHGVSILNKSDRSKRSFELSHKTPKGAWRRKNITSAQSLDRKANIKQSRELQDMALKRKNMRESRKKELESRQARKLLKPNPDGNDNVP